MSIPYLRFDKTTYPRATPTDFIDLFYNAATGQMAVRTGNTVVSLGGDVDNAAVNTAIEEDPAASREALADPNGNFPVQGVVLEDTSAVALANGVLGWNNTLQALVIHDGTTVGGVPYELPDSSHRFGTAAISSASIIAGDTEVVLTSFPLTAAQATIGNRFRVYGRISVNCNSSNVPTSAYVGLLPDASLGQGVGVVFGYDTTGFVRFDLSVSLDFNLADNSGGQFFLEDFASSSMFSKLVGSTVSMTNEALFSVSSETGPSAVAQNINVVIQFAQSNPTGSFFVIYDLRIEEVA